MEVSLWRGDGQAFHACVQVPAPLNVLAFCCLVECTKACKLLVILIQCFKLVSWIRWSIWMIFLIFISFECNTDCSSPRGSDGVRGSDGAGDGANFSPDRCFGDRAGNKDRGSGRGRGAFPGPAPPRCHPYKTGIGLCL
jgi:hypothetical protein